MLRSTPILTPPFKLPSNLIDKFKSVAKEPQNKSQLSNRFCGKPERFYFRFRFRSGQVGWQQP